MPVAKWSKCFIIRIPAVCQIQQELSNAPAFQELLHPFSIFHPLQLKQAWEHTEVGRARRIRALEPPMSVPGFGAQHDPKTSQDSSLLPLSPECSLPSAAQMGPQQLIFDWMGENSQISVNSSIRLDAFVDSPDSPSTTVKALAVAPRIALLSTLPILPVHKCSHILPVCCYMLLYVAICCYAHVTSSIHWTRWDSNTTQENMPPCDGDVGPKFSELRLSHSVTCIHWYPLCIWCFYWCALYISLYLYIILQ